MSKDYSYGWEKLHGAVIALVGEGNQRERLVNALTVCHILKVRSHEHHLPDDIQIELNKFFKKMTAMEAIEGEGTIMATVSFLNEKKVRNAVRKIVSFYDTVCRYQEPFESL